MQKDQGFQKGGGQVNFRKRALGVELCKGGLDWTINLIFFRLRWKHKC